MSDLFHPEVFLNVLRQKTARRLLCSINEMKLLCSFEQGVLHGEELLQAKGMLLQGCGFESGSGRLVDPPKDLPEFLPMPVCYLSWAAKEAKDPYSEAETGVVPVFASSTREHILC